MVINEFAAARPGRTWLWVAPGAPHSGAGVSPDYWPRVFAFLDAAGV